MKIEVIKKIEVLACDFCGKGDAHRCFICGCDVCDSCGTWKNNLYDQYFIYCSDCLLILEMNKHETEVMQEKINSLKEQMSEEYHRITNLCKAKREERDKANNAKQ